MSKDPSIKRSKIKARFKWAIILAIGGLCLLTVLIACLPPMVSSDFFRSFLVRQIEKSFMRSASIQKIEWRWTKGIFIENIRIPDDPQFSEAPIFVLEKAHIAPEFMAVLHRRIKIDADLDGLAFRLIRNADGQTNLEYMLSQLPKAPDAQEPSKTPSDDQLVMLPFDIHCMFSSQNMLIHVEDRSQNKQLTLKNASVRIQIPDLRQEPVEVRVISDVLLDQEPIPPLDIHLIGKHLMDSSGQLTPFRMAIHLDGVLPGAEISFNGSLDEKTINSRIDLDIQEIFRVFKPFLPASLIHTEVGGRILMELTASGDPKHSLSYDLCVQGEKLSGAGELLQNKTFGPMDFRIWQQGEIFPENAGLTIDICEVHFLEKTRILFSGLANGLDTDDPQVQLRLDPLRLDIKEWMNAASPFLPTALENTDIAGQLNLTMDVSGSPKRSLSYALHLQGEKIAGAGKLFQNKTLGPVNLSIRQQGTIEPEAGNFFIQTNDIRFLENTRIRFAGSAKGINTDAPQVELKLTDLTVDLKECLDAASPFLPTSLAETDLSGLISVMLNASGHPKDSLTYDFNIQGKKIAGSGALFQGKSIGPLDLSIVQNGTVEPENGNLFIRANDIQLLENTRMHLSGSAKGFKTDETQVDFRLGGLSIDFAEWMNLASPFLPPKISARITGGTFDIQKIEFNGTVPNGTQSLTLANMNLQLPGVYFKSGTSAVSAKGIHVEIPELRSRLTSLFPEQAEIQLSLKVNEMALDSGKTLQLENLEIPRIGVIAEDIKLSEQAEWGITSKIILEESISLDRVKFRDIFTATGVKNNLKLSGALLQKTMLQFNVENLGFSCSKIVANPPKLGSYSTGIKLDTTLPTCRIHRLEPLDVDIVGFKTRIDLDGIGLNLYADLLNAGLKSMKASGNIDIDLETVDKRFLKQFLRDIRWLGKTKIDWKVAGRRPLPEELERLQNNPTFALDEDLAFLDDLDVVIHADKVKTTIDLKRNRQIEVGPFSTNPSISYRLNRKSNQGELNGSILMDHVLGVPGFEFIKNPFNFDAKFKGTHRDLKSIHFEQSLLMKPFMITDSIDLTLTGVDTLLRKRLLKPSALWLKYLGGKLVGKISIPDLSTFEGMGKDWKISGKIDAGMEHGLAPNQQIQVNAWVRMPQTDLAIPGMLAIEDLKVNIDAEKTLRLQEVRKHAIGSALPLSSEVMRTDRSGLSGSESVDTAAQRRLSEMKRRYGKSYTLSFKSAETSKTPIPISLGPTQINAQLKEGIPSMDYFQIDLLGGTVLGSLTFTRKKTGFFILGEMLFSGLDTQKLNTGSGESLPNEDTELSGQISMMLPIVTDLQLLLQNLEARLMFSHIGSRSLERALYALDPYESNETIVSQRRLLRAGTPRKISVLLQNGNLSLNGSVEVKGVPIAIPNLERLNISGLPALKSLANPLMQMEMVIRILEMAAAGVLVVDQEGKVQLKDG